MPSLTAHKIALGSPPSALLRRNGDRVSQSTAASRHLDSGIYGCPWVLSAQPREHHTSARGGRTRAPPGYTTRRPTGSTTHNDRTTQGGTDDKPRRPQHRRLLATTTTTPSTQGTSPHPKAYPAGRGTSLLSGTHSPQPTQLANQQPRRGEPSPGPDNTRTQAQTMAVIDTPTTQGSRRVNIA